MIWGNFRVWGCLDLFRAEIPGNFQVFENPSVQAPLGAFRIGRCPAHKSMSLEDLELSFGGIPQCFLVFCVQNIRNLDELWPSNAKPMQKAPAAGRFQHGGCPMQKSLEISGFELLHANIHENLQDLGFPLKNSLCMSIWCGNM